MAMKAARSWANDLELGKAVEAYFATVMQAEGYTLKPATMGDQLSKGIDFTLGVLGYEVKRWQSKYKAIIFEVTQNGKRGWAFTTEADLIAFCDPTRHMAFIITKAGLQRVRKAIVRGLFEVRHNAPTNFWNGQKGGSSFCKIPLPDLQKILRPDQYEIRVFETDRF